MDKLMKTLLRLLFLVQFLMGMKELFVIKGVVQARIKRVSEGSDTWQLLWSKPVPNKVVNAGLAWIAYLLMSDTPTKFTHGAIGTGTTGPADGDTALQTQILTRIAATLSRITTSVADDTAQFVSLFTSDGVYAVTEYGTFTAASGGTMLNRLTFSAINLENLDELEFTYKCQCQRA